MSVLLKYNPVTSFSLFFKAKQIDHFPKTLNAFSPVLPIIPLSINNPVSKALLINCSDPQFSSIEKIANALGVSIADIVNSDNVFSDIDSLNKSVIEKVQLIEQLDDKQKESIFSIIDMALYNLKLKKTLSNALAI